MTQATAGTGYAYQVTATDPDNDPITYALVPVPKGMSVNATTGAITWSPQIADIGATTVHVQAADGRGGLADQIFTLTVVADTQAPQVTVNLSENPANVGDTVTITVSATDNVAVATLGLTVAGQPLSLDAHGSATYTASAIGRVAIIGTATDAAGNVGTQENDLVVRDPNDHTPPTVSFTIGNGAPITSPIDVTGTASDPNLIGYTLEAIPVAGGPSQTIFTGTSPVVNGTLGVFDPSLLPNDSYIVRLTATDANGNAASVDAAAPVDVAGNLKLGNFTLSFNDLTVPVAGIPITVTRTYDTLNVGSSGEFGPGWRLEFRDTDLRTSVEPTGLEDVGIYNPFYDGARVYVTMPGGKREGFSFHPWLQHVFFVDIWHPQFIADPGVTDTLSVPDFQLSQNGNDYYDFYGDLPYNPADTAFGPGTYTLTTKDGNQFVVDGTSGLLNSVTDRNSNVLTFSSSGINSSTGVNVTFARDSQGRITTVTDPMGQTISYTYDGNGDLATVTDRQGNVTQFVYNAARAHYLDHIIDPLGRTGVRTEYDDQGRLTSVIDAAGNSVQIHYDPDSRHRDGLRPERQPDHLRIR